MITFARFIISFTFGFIVLWANEIFPTTIRSVGMGVFFGIGIIGGFLSPFLVDLSYEIGIIYNYINKYNIILFLLIIK